MPLEAADREDRIAASSTANQATAASFYQQLLQTVSRMVADAIKPLLQARTITLWFVMDNGSTALAATTYLEAPIDFPFVITGVRVLSRATGAMVLDVGRSTTATYPIFTSLVALTPPTLAAFTYSDDLLTGWTTLINATEVLAVTVTSNAGALTRVSVGLRCRVLGPAPR